jgi:triacylglycerol lipase
MRSAFLASRSTSWSSSTLFLPSRLYSRNMAFDHTDPTPIVRWLSSWSSTPAGSPSRSRSKSPSSRSEPPSSSLRSLDEALSSQLHLPSKPPPAQLSKSFSTSRFLSRPPPLLDDLTRATLPTASLSFPSSIQSQDPPIVNISRSPTTRTSIDSLRHISDRGIHSSSSSRVNALPRLAWWWERSDNEENEVTLLNEEEQADDAQQLQEHIRKKCTSQCISVQFITLISP